MANGRCPSYYGGIPAYLQSLQEHKNLHIGKLINSSSTSASICPTSRVTRQENYSLCDNECILVSGIV